MANAYWNGVYMAYGDGGDVFEPLSGVWTLPPTKWHTALSNTGQPRISI